MIAIWSAIAVLSALGVFVLVMTTRRVTDEAALAIKAFAEFRSSLAPAMGPMQTEVARLSVKRELLRSGTPGNSRG